MCVSRYEGGQVQTRAGRHEGRQVRTRAGRRVGRYERVRAMSGAECKHRYEQGRGDHVFPPTTLLDIF